MRNSRITYLSVVLLMFAGQLCEGVDVACSGYLANCIFREMPTLEEDEPLNILHPDPLQVTYVFVYQQRNVRKLLKVIFDTFPNLTVIGIHSHIKIGRINRGDLQNAKNVKSFDFSYTQIEGIEDFSFSGLNKTTRLAWSGNKLKDIRRNTFEGLANLEELYLAYNQIETIEDGAFNFRQLHKLYLKGNKLTTISRGIFIVTPPLKKFSFGNNGLTKIGDFFDGMTELDYIEINENPVADLNFTMFAKMPKLLLLGIDLSPFNATTEEDVATAESAGSKLKVIWLSEDQLNHDFLAAIHRIFKNIWKLVINERRGLDIPNEEVLKVIPGIKIFRWVP